MSLIRRCELFITPRETLEGAPLETYLSFLVIIEAQSACNAFPVEIHLENVFKQWQCHPKLVARFKDVGSIFGTMSHFQRNLGSRRYRSFERKGGCSIRRHNAIYRRVTMPGVAWVHFRSCHCLSCSLSKVTFLGGWSDLRGGVTFLSGCHEIATIDPPGLPDCCHSAGYKLGDDFEPFTTTIALFMVFF